MANMPDGTLTDRWLLLVDAIAKECWAHDQSPDGGVLDLNEVVLKVSLPLDDSTRLPREFTRAEVIKGDHAVLASKFYANYLLARKLHRGGA